MTARHHQPRFERLLHEHRNIVFKVAGVYARGADRDDLAQEIAAQLWRSFGSYDEARAKFSTWMYRIALNVAISHGRRQRGDPVARSEPLDAWHLDTIGGAELPEPDARIDRMMACIGQLDPLNRALVLLYLEERSYAEIADVLGISQTNVATKLGRIKQKLRGQMTGAQTTGA
jgi:RNA polymerase sigma-70 factor (ECF subfamily)